MMSATLWFLKPMVLTTGKDLGKRKLILAMQHSQRVDISYTKGTLSSPSKGPFQERNIRKKKKKTEEKKIKKHENGERNETPTKLRRQDHVHA